MTFSYLVKKEANFIQERIDTKLLLNLKYQYDRIIIVYPIEEINCKHMRYILKESAGK